MNIFLEKGLGQAPRILGLCDRNPEQKTFGCFDRPYWNYKIKDIVNGRLQEGCYYLALLYTIKHDENKFYKKEKIKELALASLKYASNIQNRDGSFNEVYPFERSFCATAFLTMHMTETMLLMENKENIKIIKKAAQWLMRHSHKEVANQTAAAALALYNTFLLTQEKQFLEGCKIKIAQLLKQQKNGYYQEYRGYDIGYQSITMGIVLRMIQKDKKEELGLKNSIQKAYAFIEGKIGKEGHYDNTETSRKTQFVYPFIFSERPLREEITKGLKKDKILNPAWLDDRYVIPLAIDYLETGVNIKSKE